MATKEQLYAVEKDLIKFCNKNEKFFFELIKILKKYEDRLYRSGYISKSFEDLFGILRRLERESKNVKEDILKEMKKDIIKLENEFWIEIVSFNALLDYHIHLHNGFGYTKVVDIIYKVGRLKEEETNEILNLIVNFIDSHSEEEIIELLVDESKELVESVLEQKRRRMRRHAN